MKINGIMLQGAIRTLKSERDLLYGRFKDQLFVFEGEDETMTPDVLALRLLELETRIVGLQTLQVQYNASVSIRRGDFEMTLGEAIKMVGPIGRVSKKWREVASETGRESYRAIETLRANDQVAARRTVSVKDAMTALKELDKNAQTLRNALAKGNSTLLEIEIDPGLAIWDGTNLFE